MGASRFGRSFSALEFGYYYHEMLNWTDNKNYISYSYMFGTSTYYLDDKEYVVCTEGEGVEKVDVKNEATQEINAAFSNLGLKSFSIDSFNKFPDPSVKHTKIFSCGTEYNGKVRVYMEDYTDFAKSNT